MKLYRIARQPYARDLNGVGARLNGGRWNSPGLPLLYTASTRALAVLEVLVHIPQNFIPNNLEMITLELPDNVSKQEISYADIADIIKKYGIKSNFAAVGDQWIKGNSSLLLVVPSIVVPEEKNILINPLHKEAGKIKVIEEKPFQLDGRLLK